MNTTKTLEQDYEVCWDFNFADAQFADNTIDLTPLSAANLLAKAKEIQFLRNYNCELASVGQYNFLRKRGYIQRGDIVDNPLRIMFPQSRTYRETHLQYNEFLKSYQAKETNFYSGNGWGVLYVDDAKTDDEIQTTIANTTSSLTNLDNRLSNRLDVFVFNKTKLDTYQFRLVYHLILNDVKPSTFETTSISDRYYFKNGNLSVILHKNNPGTPFNCDFESLIEKKYPFLCKEKGSTLLARQVYSPGTSALESITQELRTNANIKTVLLHVSKTGATDYISYKEFIESCNQLKSICDFFCIDIYLVLIEEDFVALQNCTDKDAKAFFSNILSIDSFIYASRLSEN